MVQTRFIRLILPAAAVFCLAVACETDPREVDRLASIEAEDPVDISRGVTVIFSDSAVVKAKIVASEMRQYRDTDQPYYEFPEGIVIHFYDPEGVETQQITSDYAVRYEYDERVEFHRNVVITRADGIRIETEELIYDEKEEIFYNSVPISGYSPDGRNTFHGASFRSDAALKNIEVQNTTGAVVLEGDHIPSN